MSTINASNIQTSEIRFNGTSTNAITINESGLLSMTENPFYYGWRDTGTEAWETFASTSIYVYNIASENKGGHYNTSTGVFTCPLAGVYLICPSALMGQGGGQSTLQVFKNGVNVTTRGIHSNTVGVNVYYQNCSTFAIDCAVNDQLTPRMTTATSANVYGREHSHLSIWYYG
jgi:hypothetical protein